MKTFSQLMVESDQSGNIHGMPKITYWRARTVWKARLSTDPELATKAHKMIIELDSGKGALGRATRLLGLETSNKPRDIPVQIATIQRIAATLDGLTQVTSEIGNLNSIDPDEATDLANRIIESCKKISRVARRLQKVGER